MTEPLIIAIPVFNDWPALRLLLRAIDRIPLPPAHVLAIDDGSTMEPGPDLCAGGFERLAQVTILRLRRNLGHQRAISTGLVYIHENFPEAVTVVMDGDGEDKPEDIVPMLEKFQMEDRRKIIFAERTRRTESMVFRAFYRIYKVAHYALTGVQVRVGNFSVIPYRALSSLVVTSEIWNHYAAAVLATRLPHDSVPTARGVRLSGKSHMNFVSLVVHGLSAMSLYGDRVGVRLLSLSVCLIGLLMLAVLATLFIAGWTAHVLGLLTILLMQAVLMCFVSAFITLSNRSSVSFLPLRDCPYFVGSVRTVYLKNAG